MTQHIREKINKLGDRLNPVSLTEGNRLIRVIFEEILDELDQVKLLSELHEPNLTTKAEASGPIYEVFKHELHSRMKAKGKKK